MRYAEKPCEVCGLYLSLPELRKVRVYEKAGYSHSRSTYLGRSRSTRIGDRSHYRKRTCYVCADCPDPRSEGAVGRLFHRLVLGSAIVGGLVLVLPNLLSTQPESEPGAAMDAAEGELESAPAPVESPTDPSADRQAFQPFEGATATTQAPESEAADARILETAGTATDEPSSFDFDDEQITAAIERALGEGKTVRWRTEVAKGFAVPSVPTMANGIECRNLYIQAEADGQEVATPVRSYCLKGERWELQGS